jgi:nucleotide-binding universal stress UspA family protein
MRPILSVIDLTQTTTQVLEVAARMAYAYKSHLTILFPYRLIDKGYSGEISKLKLKLEQEARDKFLSIKAQVPLLDQISYDLQTEIGFPADRINAFLRKNKVDAIVIGQRQANSINETGNLALQNLIKTSKLPFTIVPEDIDAEVFTQ